MRSTLSFKQCVTMRIPHRNSRRSFPGLLSISGLALVLGLAAGFPSISAEDKSAQADSKESAEDQALREKRERYLAWMKDYARETEITLPAAADGTRPKATPVELPLIRYSDEEHRIPDATLWAWTHNNRPVAFQKVEGNNWGGGRQWTICFASLSEKLITVQWSKKRTHAMTKPGLRFQPITDAEAPATNPRLRSNQIRMLKVRFTAKLGNSDGSSRAVSRTLPKPLLEYADPETKLPIGAVFGMTASGTNPNVLLVIEARPGPDGQLRWEYAHARMTGSSMELFDKDIQLKAEGGSGSGDFGNWIYFFLPRSFE